MELPDGTRGARPRCDSVARVVTPGDPQAGHQRTVEVVVVLDDPAAAGDLDQAPVDVQVVTVHAEDALAVPVEALLALAEGGYAARAAGRVRWSASSSAPSPTATWRSPATSPRATRSWCRREPTVLALGGRGEGVPGHAAGAALDGVDLAVDDGELVAVVGPSGSGKSTLLNIVGALDRPRAARSRIAGADIGALERRGALGAAGPRASASCSSSSTCSTAHRPRQRRHRAALPRRAGGPSAGDGPRSPWSGSASATASTTARRSCPAASASAWPSPGRWSASRRSSWPTSPPATSTPAPATEVLDLLRALHATGSTIVVITHDAGHRRVDAPLRVHPRRPHRDDDRCAAAESRRHATSRRAGCGRATSLAVGSLGLRSRRGRTVLTAARHRHRHRRHGGGDRHLGVEPGRPARRARRARHEPPAGAARAVGLRRGQRAAETAPPDDPPHRRRSSRRPPPAPSARSVRRTDLVDDAVTGGIARGGDRARAAGDARRRRWPTAGSSIDATGAYPTVVLGSEAAARLGIDDLDGRPAGVARRAVVHRSIGILDPVPLAPDIDRSALDRLPRRRRTCSASTTRRPPCGCAPTPTGSRRCATCWPPTAEPGGARRRSSVTRPSDALAARAAADEALTALLLGLGGVALLVGGIGIANVLVISVLERRTEIGIRRALGATRRHIRLQFLVEAVLLAAVGGLGGVLLGSAVTAGYASFRDWTVAVPVTALAGGVGVALAVGALAGLYPAARAARLAPADAVRPL